MNDLKFTNIGRGISLAGAWIEINGSREWVTFTAASDAPLGKRSQPTTWHCSASYVQGKKVIRAMATIAAGHRSDAAALALSGLEG